MSFKTDQENFWASDFGKNYIDRNKGKKLLASNLNFFTRVLKNTHGIKTCIEFGANIGMNIQALKLLYPEQEHFAIEINSEAIKDLQKVIPQENIFEGSILNYNSKKIFDLTLEILITSIERDGTLKGYDLNLIETVVNSVKIPVIASGGAGSYQDMIDAVNKSGASAVAAASMFHFTEQTPLGAKNEMEKANIPIRKVFQDATN